jgi:hypothetical protein
MLVLLVEFLFAAVGNITALNGESSIVRDSQNIKAVLGFELEEKDTIHTTMNANVQITFTDKTIIDIGKNSTFNIASYIFDTKNPTYSTTHLNILEGTFKAITGEVGKINPSKFKLQTKNATIGIRGTIIIGDQNYVGCLEGIIAVTSQGETVILKAGEITSTLEGSKPTAPQPIKNSDIQLLNDKLTVLSLTDIGWKDNERILAVSKTYGNVEMPQRTSLPAIPKNTSLEFPTVTSASVVLSPNNLNNVQEYSSLSNMFTVTQDFKDAIASEVNRPQPPGVPNEWQLPTSFKADLK